MRFQMLGVLMDCQNGPARTLNILQHNVPMEGARRGVAQRPAANSFAAVFEMVVGNYGTTYLVSA